MTFRTPDDRRGGGGLPSVCGPGRGVLDAKVGAGRLVHAREDAAVFRAEGRLTAD